jgi:hypothetical protein
MNGGRPCDRAPLARKAEQTRADLRPTLMEGRTMFRIYEWNFSATAEAVVGALLAITLVATMFV